MVKIKKQIKDSFYLIDIIDDKSLAILNKIAGRYYRRPSKQNITVRRQDKPFKFYKHLMQTPPGFDKEGDK